MKTNRRIDLIAGIALSSSLVFAATGSAQMVRPLASDAGVKYGTIIRQSVPAAPTTKSTMHLGSGPIDRNNLSADILNCDVCRQRLGLPPLGISSRFAPTTTPTVPSTEVIVRGVETSGIRMQDPKDSPKIGFEANANRMLGSPGLISSGTAEQMASQGIVFEEFKPQIPAQDAIRLGDLPPGVREQFLRSLELPAGATVTSANIKGQSSAEEIKAERLPSTIVPSAGRIQLPIENTMQSGGYPQSLGAPGIASLSESLAQTGASANAKAESVVVAAEPLTKPSPKSEVIAAEQEAMVQLQKRLNEQAAELAKKQLELEQAAALERAKESAKVSEQLEQLQTEWKKRIEQADAANREVLSLLEKRTAEVTELQLQLKSQQEALEKAQQEAPSKVKPESKKKAPNKGKKPQKTTIDT